MRKILALVLSFLLLMIGVTTSVAEETIDFSEYTLEELLEIRALLEEEIASRPGGEKMTLGQGTYKIGEDIPAGIYVLRYIQNGDSSITRTDYYVYENESMYKYDVDRLWLGDLPRVQGSLKGDGETRISLYSGEYLVIYYNGAEVARVGNAPDRKDDYVVPTGTTIPKGEYTIGEEIPAGTYKIMFSGTSTSRVRVFRDAEEAGNMFNKGKEFILDATNPEGTVTLAEGNIFRVEYTPIIMTKGGFTFE